MNHRKRKVNRLLALLLCFCMVIPSTGNLVFAAPADSNLCDHHTVHTEDCGYREGREGNPCNHVHDETCGYVAPTEAISCAHVHDETCGYADASAEVPCDQNCADNDGDGQIDHQEGCAYQPEKGGSDCTHVHDGACGYAEASAGQSCTHIHDETCGYAEAVEASPCTFVCEFCSDKIEQNEKNRQIQEFTALSEETQIQEVNVGTALSALSFPSELSITDSEGEAATLTEITWQPTPEFNEEAAGEYVFTPILPETYIVMEGVSRPEIRVAVKAQNQAEYFVSDAKEFQEALTQIGSQQEQTDFVIILKSDISLSEKFAGLPGKHITLKSEGDGNYSIALANELQGGITLDNVEVSVAGNSALFANGHTFETTENFNGRIASLYGGGSQGNNVEGGTEIIWKGGTIGSALYGGGLDSNVNGDVKITIDGGVVLNSLYGGGCADETDSGKVSGNVTIDFRKGTIKQIFGGGQNVYSQTEDNREPASVSGTVTLNMGYEGAPASSVWPGTAMYSYAGSYHSTVGNTVLNVTDGVTTKSDAGDRNIFGCGYSDTVRGTVKINIFGSPDILHGFIYGGGSTENAISSQDKSIKVLNEENKPYAIDITYNVPKELSGNATGHGINAGSNNSIPMTVNGHVRVGLESGNMDFIVLDNENFGNCTINGNAEIIIKQGRVAQVQGNQKHYTAEGSNYYSQATLIAGGEIETGYFYYFDRVHITDSAKVLADSEKFSQFGSTIQKPFYSVNNLRIDNNGYLTTRNSSTSIQNGVVMENGTWHAKGYVYIYETMASQESRIYFDNYYQIGKNHSEEPDPSGVTRFSSKNDEFSAMYNTYLNQIYGDVKVEGGTWSLLSRTNIKGNAEFSNLTLQLPVVQEGENYTEGSIPLNIDGTASGNVSVVTVQADRPEEDATMDATQWQATKVCPQLGDNYITGFAKDGTSAGNTPPQDTFILTNEDAASQGYYLKRVQDADPAAKDTYFMWQVAKQEPQPWYYEVYYEFFDETVGEFVWTSCKDGQGGSAVPNQPVSISHETFDNTELGWNDVSGKDPEELGVHYVYDPNYPNTETHKHRLSAKVSEATQENPLKIYYRAKLNEVVYAYEGTVPQGAEALLPEKEQKPYSSPVKVAEAPTLEGYEFSGWKVESPDYTTIKDGIFTMPNETVTLVGSWKKVEEPPVITIKAMDMGVYTGGESMNGNSFPIPRYTVSVPDGVELDKITFQYGEQTFQIEEENTPVIISELDEVFIYDEESLQDDVIADAPAANAIALLTEEAGAENDIEPGEYEITLEDVDGIAIQGSGAKVKFDPGILTVRYVSNPTETVVNQNDEFSTPIVKTAPTKQRGDGMAIGVLSADTEIKTNGQASLGVLGTETEQAEIHLMFDHLLPAVEGGDGSVREQMLKERAKVLGYTLIDGQYQYKYLDLINAHDGNAWVTSSQGVDVYWPYPEGTDSSDTFQVLLYDDVNREYGIGSTEKLEDQINGSTISVFTGTPTDAGVKFHLEENDFGPCALIWTKSEPVPPEDGTGNLTISKTVSGNGGSTTKAFTFTVTLGDDSINGTYGDLVFENGVAVFTLKHGESKTASGLPAGTHYTTRESDNSGYTVTAFGDTGVIEEDKTMTAAFYNYRDSEGGNTDDEITAEPVGPEQPTKPENPDGSATPGIPANPSKPESPGKSETPKGDAPQTGDTTNLELWITLLWISGIGVTVTLVLGKKKRYHGKHIK